MAAAVAALSLVASEVSLVVAGPAVMGFAGVIYFLWRERSDMDNTSDCVDACAN